MVAVSGLAENAQVLTGAIGTLVHGAGVIEDKSTQGFEQAIYEALHHQFVAGAEATRLCHELVPGGRMGCMLTKLITYPLTCAPEDVAAAQAAGQAPALIDRLVLDPPRVRKELERNPSGIYVVDFSFSREAA